jgi:ketosteroid isomerase-like protein
MRINCNLAALALVVALPTQADDVADILAAERVLCAAFEAEDAAALERGLSADFTLVDSRGTLTRRADEVAALRTGAVRYGVFRNEGTQVRLHGDAAIATGVTHVAGAQGDMGFQASFRFTDTWVRQDGRWLLAASHASRLPEAESPAR